MTDELVRVGAANPLEETVTCRFCLEEGGLSFSDPNSPDRIIHPCNCSGSSGHVHRRCLDQWRATSTRPNAFYECTECKAPYKITSIGFDEAAAAREAQFKMVRDIFLAVASFQLFFVLTGLIVYGADAHRRLPVLMKMGATSAYVLAGVVIGLAVIGVVGIIYAIVQACLVGQNAIADPYCCICVGPGNCDCGDCGEGEGGLICLLVMVVLLAATGLFCGLYFAGRWVMQRAARRMQIIRSSAVVRYFVVADKNDVNNNAATLTEAPIFSKMCPRIVPGAELNLSTHQPIKSKKGGEYHDLDGIELQEM